MKKTNKILSVIAVCALNLSAVYGYETTAKQALVMDYATGKLLYEKEASTKMYPASMTKMMTVYIAFEDLKAGRVNEAMPIKVSAKAHNAEGSKMFIADGEEVPLGELLKGIIVVSGNDASIALAEALAGSEKEFAVRMNQTAQRLGMANTNFTNAAGLPDENHYTTAHDLYILAKATLENFPEYYKIYAMKEFTWNKITQQNRNPILKSANYAVDGLKTGHTDISGYGITASAVKNNRRVIVVIHGMKNDKERASETEKIMNWAMNNFTNATIFPEPEKELFQISVFEGDKAKIPVGVAKSENILMALSLRNDTKITAKFQEPLLAPVKIGQQVGNIMIESPALDAPLSVPLIAMEGVEEVNFLAKLSYRLKKLLRGGQ